MEDLLENDVLEIMDSHRIMAISTVRPDGWPQTTIVGYAHDRLTIYFVIFRSSQKFANIEHDSRVSVAIGKEPEDLRHARAVYAGAYASEVKDRAERDRAWDLLVQRHPNLAEFNPPQGDDTVIMRAQCRYVSVVDYAKGLGHSESITVEVEPPKNGGSRGQS